MNAHVLALALRRVLAAALFVLVVSACTFLVVQAAPGDAATAAEAAGVLTPEAAARTRTRLGLDRSAGEQFVHWASGVLRLDLGQSTRYQRPVTELLAHRAVNTATLASLALLVATAIGLPLGVWTGSRPSARLARLVAVISIALLACPPLLAALLLLALALATGALSLAPGAFGLPVLALALPLAAMLERLQSQATMEAMAAPEIGAAAARGVPSWRLIWVHAFRPSLRSVLGTYGVVIAGLFSGSLAVEAVTNWPGIGRLLFDAVTSRDLSLAAGCGLTGAIFIAVGNLGADALRAWADPRVRG